MLKTDACMFAPWHTPYAWQNAGTLENVYGLLKPCFSFHNLKVQAVLATAKKAQALQSCPWHD
jgi:hypothetical protein